MNETTSDRFRSNGSQGSLPNVIQPFRRIREKGGGKKERKPSRDTYGISPRFSCRTNNNTGLNKFSRKSFDRLEFDFDAGNIGS